MEDVYALFQKPKNPTDFDAIRIKLASSEKIREWSYGEVRKPETINYRTFKPERDGLFCAKIFGPIKDWECLCGKYKRMKHRGVVCDKCGVEVIQQKVRRERMGHIELAAPVAHIWFLKGVPSRIGTLLDMTMRHLEKVIYFENYIVIEPGETPLKEKELLTEEDYRKKVAEYGSKFKVGMGAEAIRELLKKLDLKILSEKLKTDISLTRSVTKRGKLAKRLRVVEAFRLSGNKPEWMIMDAVPVLPPDLRPLVPLEGGRFATSDLNDLYRRVINRNNRLKRLMELKAPSVIIKNEKRMLQEAVDALFDNGRRIRVLKTATKRPLKSLSDMIKGKQGRFRQNLLGKRVDYSGRSVIVVGPELKLHQCGLPKSMALELFKPFVFNRLVEQGHVTKLKDAKLLVEKELPEVWDALEEVISEHPVLLNRAPTLHRLGIQAFDPLLVEGKAIRLHPLVCTAFNADFDGDQMAVHVPLSLEAQIEARVLMMSVNNILSPANGEPVIGPTQDIVLGIYWLTKDNPEENWNGKVFSDESEVRIAYDHATIKEHEKIKVRICGEIVETTTGRIIFKEILPCGIPFVLINKPIHKNDIQILIKYLHREFGKQDTVEFLNKLVGLGFEYATRSGISVCMDDIIACKSRDSLIKEMLLREAAYKKPHNDGEEDVICPTQLEDNQEKLLSGLWQEAVEKITDNVKSEYEMADNTFNSIDLMIRSGARGSWEDICQISGIIGYVIGFNKKITSRPLLSNYKTGFSPSEFFLSTHSLREMLLLKSDLAASSVWLMRRLIDVVQDIIISEYDCRTRDGIYAEAKYYGFTILQALNRRITGRFSAEELRHPITGGILIRPDEEITELLANNINEAGIEKLKIRSVLTCQSIFGVCSKCYGTDLPSADIVDIGEAVGIIAAQSISEPITQLAFNRFNQIKENLPSLVKLFEARKFHLRESLDPNAVFKESGIRVAQLGLLMELQSNFINMGIFVHDKHFEVIIRKMTEKVRIDDPGDTMYLIGELIDKDLFYQVNASVQFEGGRIARATPVVLSITKAALTSDSWISAASFQETTKVLIDAAINAQIDELKGLKENIIMGRVVPSGTGTQKYRNTFVKRELPELFEE